MQFQTVLSYPRLACQYYGFLYEVTGQVEEKNVFFGQPHMGH